MRVLIAYASANGSTAEIAAEIGRRFEAAGIDHEVVAAAAVTSAEGFDAVVIGSAVHSQAWLSSAHDMVHRLAREIGNRPVWLFSVSSVGQTSSVFGSRMSGLIRRARTEPNDVAGVRAVLRVRDHRNFAGVVERDHWGRSGHWFLRLFGGTYGDHRDWRDIDAWADGIVAALDPARVPGA